MPTQTLNPGIDAGSFEYIRGLVLERSAIALEPGKEYLVESRLSPLARQHGLASLQELVATLRRKPFGMLHEQVIDAMTTNETSFFRDISPFDALRQEVLPAIIKARDTRKMLRIWSAACSSGQEPYSIAMLLREHFPQLQQWNVQIIATDLSHEMLKKAESGEYTQAEVGRGLPAPMLVKYFDRHGLRWQVKEELRRQVKFSKLNFIEAWPVLPTMDVVFIRNVLIYFTTETKRGILSRIHRQLAPDGVMFLGGAETTMGVDECWERVACNRSSYYRPKNR